MNGKSKTIAALILGTTFVLGIVSGMAGTLWYVKSVVVPDPEPKVDSIAMRHENQLDRMVARLDRELGFTGEQEALVRKELERVGEAFAHLHEHTKGEMRSILEAGHTEIRQHLNPEQVDLYNAFVERRIERMRRQSGDGKGEQKRWGDRGRDSE